MLYCSCHFVHSGGVSVDAAAYALHPLVQAVAVTDLVTIHYFEYTKDYRYQGESHDFWEIMYADRGAVVVRCGETEHVLSRGELILLPPGAFHTLRVAGQAPSNVFIISFAESEGSITPLTGRVLRLTAAMKDLVRAMIREGKAAFVLPMPQACRGRLQPRQDAPLGSQQLVKMRLEELLILLLRDSGAVRSVQRETRYDGDIAARVMQLLRENLHRQLSLADITSAMGYGKTYLSGVFKTVYGESIMDCCTRLKMEEAKYLLRQGTLSVAEISEYLGFSSPQYFSKRFSAVVHMSPRQYALSVKESWATEAE